MKTGTKSILYGAHCFLLHPVFVAVAWVKLFGWTWDPRVWVAFFVHDLGYWGKPNMDGKEGETHPELGAKIMHFLFDGWKTEIVCRRRMDEWEYQNFLKNGWKCVDASTREYSVWDYEFLTFRRRVRKTTWYDFTLYHSRYYAKRKGARPSKLCYADKLAFVITPQWLYLPMAKSTGEIEEYMKEFLEMFGGEKTFNAMGTVLKRFMYQWWHCDAVLKTREWVEEHKDGKPDTWTESRHKVTDPLAVLREDTYTNEETDLMVGKMIRTQNASRL